METMSIRPSVYPWLSIRNYTVC